MVVVRLTTTIDLLDNSDPVLNIVYLGLPAGVAVVVAKSVKGRAGPGPVILNDGSVIPPSCGKLGGLELEFTVGLGTRLGGTPNGNVVFTIGHPEGASRRTGH